MEEINYFKQLHNGSTDQIIPLITEGDPETVFPAALLTTTVFNEELGVYEETAVEPLAANVSAATPRESKRKFNTEMLRIAATMLSCGFDNLFLRERKRKRRRNTLIITTAFVLALLFGIYSVTTMMKISNQNSELEQKNNALVTKTRELNLSNENLTQANSKLDLANIRLEDINNTLDQSNLTLEAKNSELDAANAELNTKNSELDAANAELNTKNSELDAANTELNTKNSELDAANTELNTKNSELDAANTSLAQTNSALEEKTQEALDNYHEAQQNLELAEHNLAIAEEQTRLAEERKKTADEQRKIAEEQKAEAEEQRKIADEQTLIAIEEKQYALQQEQKALTQEQKALEEKQKALEQEQEALRQKKIAEEQRQAALENLRLYQEKNAELMEANAELAAVNSARIFADEYDRVGAIEELFKTPLYKENPESIRPSAQRFLNEVLYSYSIQDIPHLRHTLNTERVISDFSFSPDLTKIVAFDVSGTVYVFDVDTGETLYKQNLGDVINAAFSDDSHITVVCGFGVKNIRFSDNKVEWDRPSITLSGRSTTYFHRALFSKDRTRLVIWDEVGCFVFLESATGKKIAVLDDQLDITGYYKGSNEDFTDGLHFTAVAYNNQKNTNLTVYIDIDKMGYNLISGKKDSTPLAVRYIGSDQYALVEKVKFQEGSEAYENGSTILRVINNNGITVRSILLDEYLVDFAEIKTVFTNYDVDPPATYVAVSGTLFTDNVPVVFFVNVASGETETHRMPSPVRQVGYRGVDGWVSIYTANGAQYQYNVSDGTSMLGNTTVDSGFLDADGSRKMVWVSNDLAAALGAQSSKIMIYSTQVPEPVASMKGDTDVTNVMEGNDFFTVERSGVLEIYNESDKTLRYSFALDYTPDQGLIKGDCVYLFNEAKEYLYRYDAKDGTSSYYTLGGYSNYSEWTVLTGENTDRVVAVSRSCAVIITEHGCRKVRFNDLYIAYEEYNLICLSPDGTRLIAESYIEDDLLHVDLIDLDNGNAITLATSDSEIVDATVYRKNMTFSNNGSLAAYVGRNCLYIHNARTGDLINSVPLDCAICTLGFNGDDTRIMLLDEAYELTEYDVETGAQTNHTKLSESLRQYNPYSKTDRDETYLQLNPERGELCICNKKYAVFIDLDRFEPVLVLDYTQINYLRVLKDGSTPNTMSSDFLCFLKNTQELALQYNQELFIFPYYTVGDLVKRSQAI